MFLLVATAPKTKPHGLPGIKPRLRGQSLTIMSGRRRESVTILIRLQYMFRLPLISECSGLHLPLGIILVPR